MKLTFNKTFTHYRNDEVIPAASVNGLVCIDEPSDYDYLDHGIRRIMIPTNQYMTGPVVEKLYKYEALGYEPEELAKKLKRLEELEKAQKGFREKFKLDLKTPDIHQLTGNTHRFNRDEIAAIEAALKRDDKAVTFTRTDDEVMVTIAPWSGEEE